MAIADGSSPPQDGRESSLKQFAGHGLARGGRAAGEACGKKEESRPSADGFGHVGWGGKGGRSLGVLEDEDGMTVLGMACVSGQVNDVEPWVRLQCEELFEPVARSTFLNEQLDVGGSVGRALDAMEDGGFLGLEVQRGESMAFGAGGHEGEGHGAVGRRGGSRGSRALAADGEDGDGVVVDEEAPSIVEEFPREFGHVMGGANAKMDGGGAVGDGGEDVGHVAGIAIDPAKEVLAHIGEGGVGRGGIGAGAEGLDGPLELGAAEVADGYGGLARGGQDEISEAHGCGEDVEADLEGRSHWERIELGIVACWTRESRVQGKKN